MKNNPQLIIAALKYNDDENNDDDDVKCDVIGWSCDENIYRGFLRI